MMLTGYVSDWRCGICTYVNVSENANCEICGSARPVNVRRVNTRAEATKAIDSLMDFFDHDVNKMMCFVGPSIAARSRPAPEPQTYSFFQEEQVEDGGAMHDDSWWNDEYSADSSWQEQFDKNQDEFQASIDQQLEEILREIEQFEMDLGSKETMKVEAEMEAMQESRRRESMMALQKRLSTAPDASGKRMSRLDAKNIVLESAMEIAAQEEQEDLALEADEVEVAEDEEEPEPEFKYLPYIPMEGDQIDAAVAELVNTHEIDVLISRPAEFANRRAMKANKRNYKVGGVKYTVRCIHEMLIAKPDDSTKWTEFGPTLKEIAATES